MSRLRSTLGPFVIALFVAIGFQLVWFVAASWTLSMVEPRQIYEWMQFQADGTPIIVDNADDNHRYHDIDGRSLEFSLASQTNFYRGTSLPRHDHPKPSDAPAPWRRRMLVYTDYRKPVGYWYLMSEGWSDGSAFFVGYDSYSNERIGFIGLNGLQTKELPAAERIPFPADPDGATRIYHTGYSYYYHGYPHTSEYSPVADDIPPWIAYVHSYPDTIHCVDFQQRTIRVAFKHPAIRSAAMTVAPLGPDNAQRNRLLVRLADEVVLIGPKDNVERRTPIPPAIRDRSFEAWFPAQDGTSTVTVFEPHDDFEKERRGECFRIAADGTVIRQSPLHLRHFDQRMYQWFVAIVAPTPIFVDAMALFVFPQSMIDSEIVADYSEALKITCRRFWPALVLVHLIAVASILPTLRRERQYAHRSFRTWTWCLFVFVFGFPGWFGYRFAQRWPRRELCKACGQQAPRDQEKCAFCGVDFPLPEPRGIEIFG